MPFVAAKRALAHLRRCALTLGTLERSGDTVPILARRNASPTIPQRESTIPQRESTIGVPFFLAKKGSLLNFGTTFAPLRFTLGSVASHPIPPQPQCRGHGSQPFQSEAMNTEKFEGHDEGWRTLWLAIAGVMAITLTWNVLMVSLNGISY